MTRPTHSVSQFLAPCFLASLLATMACGAHPAQAHQGWSDSPRFLPFLNQAPDGERRFSPKLALTIDGTTIHTVMDTGSTGIVVSLATMFPDWRSDPDLVAKIDAALPPGDDAGAGPIDTGSLDTSRLDRITYSSSGRILYGVYVDRPVTIAGAATADGTVRSVTTTPVPVLAVIDVECTTHARDCTPDHAPTGIGMLGVGYGRAAPGDRYGTRTLNPFLNLAPARSRSATEAGYAISADGVKVGLDPDDVAQGGISVAQLQPDPTMPGEWSAPQATISLASRQPASGSLLVDTGISSMYMTVPSAISANLRVASGSGTDSTLAKGTDIAIQIANTDHGTVGYAFNTAQTGRMVPSQITLVGNDGSKPDWKKSFVNTGVRFLNEYDYMFDDKDGWVGFVRRSAAR